MFFIYCFTAVVSLKYHLQQTFDIALSTVGRRILSGTLFQKIVSKRECAQVGEIGNALIPDFVGSKISIKDGVVTVI